MKSRSLFNLVIQMGLLASLVLSGCAGEKPAGLRVSGAVDVLPVLEKNQQDLEEILEKPLSLTASRDALSDLRSGRADAAILGREAAPEELAGLSQEVIAYDAVCVLVSRRLYQGGVEIFYVTIDNKKLLQPKSKYAGLQNISLEDLRQFYAFQLKKINTWVFPGSYFVFTPFTVGNSMIPKENDKNPGYVAGSWEWKEVPMIGELLPAGMSDAQGVFLERLGFSAEDAKIKGVNLVPLNISAEEEWISMKFTIDPPELLETQESTLPFNFYLMPVSRQVAVRALEHGFTVRMLPVDGADPADPETIYSGQYPFSRRVYIVVRQQGEAEQVKLLRDFLKSPQGQELISRVGFLPVKAEP